MHLNGNFCVRAPECQRKSTKKLSFINSASTDGASCASNSDDRHECFGGATGLWTKYIAIENALALIMYGKICRRQIAAVLVQLG